MTVSDEDLTARLDGELDPARAASIDAALAADPALRARMAGLEIDATALKNAFAPLLDAPCDFPGAAPARPPAARSWAWQAAAAAAVLAVGLGLGARLAAPSDTWMDEVAHYQALYVPETLAGIKPDMARLHHQLETAGGALGHPLDQAALSGFEDLTLRRAQVLGFRGKALVQVAYTDASGMPFAFCIIAQGAQDSGKISTRTLVGQAVADWSSPSHSFMTIGGQDEAKAGRFAAWLESRV